MKRASSSASDGALPVSGWARETLDAEVRAVLARLHSPEVIYYPVRHHSPACALHLQRLIARERPSFVLVEGPANFTPLIPLILHEKTRAPFAVYTYSVEPGPRGADGPPERAAAYYPFCDYSPELVALHAGRAVGARLRFVDLPYRDQVRAERAAGAAPVAPDGRRTESLLQERYLQRSAYLRELAARTGCRDGNDLWDHLFEANGYALETGRFMADVAAYCFLARRDATPAELEAEGTAARERMMAACVAQALDERAAEGADAGPVLVVTGGFHTVALPGLVDTRPAPPALAPENADGAQHTLIRYSFEQLDALNGYAAGMPSPEFYQRVWRGWSGGEDDAALAVAGRFVVELGRSTREGRLQIGLSPADEIAALTQARLLARVRGHAGPTREDLLDSVRSCFVKGAMDAEGEVLLALARRLLRGTAVGEIPPGAGTPPLVADFRQRAARLRLNATQPTPRAVALDLYRRAPHREASRFLHSLVFLGVPFATAAGGPDFVRGTDLQRLQEHWEYLWTPAVEGRLVEAAVYGATVPEAAAGRLLEAVAELGREARGRDAAAAVGMLVRACRMGLHAGAGQLLPLTARSVAEEGRFAVLVGAAGELLLLWQSREPLEAHRLPEIPALLSAAYQRACYLVPTLARCPEGEIADVLDALGRLREWLTAAPDDHDDITALDGEIFWQALAGLLAARDCQPVIRGAAARLLTSQGRLPEDGLLALVAGSLGGAAGDWQERVGFLRGLLATCREAAWQNAPLLRTLDGLLSGWDETEFLRALPELRLAFSGFTPRETDRVAAGVAALHGAAELGNLDRRDVRAADFDFHGRVSAAVLESLRADGLGAWLEPG